MHSQTIRMSVKALPYFISKRIAFRSHRAVSQLMVRLTILTVALAIGVMEIASSLVQGFETAITDKVIGFVSHIQIREYNTDEDNNPELHPLRDKTGSLKLMRNQPFVEHISPYILKWAMVEKSENMEVFMLKGIDGQYDWGFFGDNLRAGKLPDFSGGVESLEVLVSQKQAEILDLKIGDKLTISFIQDPIKRRPVKVAGIYNTGFEEFDKITLFCDLRMLQNVMGWQPDEVMGYEVDVKDSRNLYAKADSLNMLAGDLWEAVPVTELPVVAHIFDWLTVQHQNVWLILTLMMAVAIINMTTVVLILIIERTYMIGILNALGMRFGQLQRVFVWNMGMLMLPGIVLGNVVGLGLLASQYYGRWLQLDPENYFLDSVPVAWCWDKFLLINLAALGVCTLAMFLPTLIVSTIKPVKAIGFR